MPFSGGVYTLPAGNPVVTSSVISSTVQNTTMSDVATALSTAMLKDGSQTITNNIPMSGFKFTGMGNGSAVADSATIGNIQNGTGTYSGTVGGTADAITLTPTAVITAYVAGQRFSFIAAGSNTTAATVNVNAVGVKNITKLGTTALSAGDIPSGAIVVIEYDGTQFQLLGVRASASGSALTVTARSTNTILGVSDLGAMFQFTSTFTQTLTAAATLGSGWYIDLQNIGTGVITLDANSSETFNTSGGARTTINVYPGEGFRLVCNATGFDLVGRKDRVLLGVIVASSSNADCETGFTDTEFQNIQVRFSNLITSGGSAAGFRVRKSGAYITTTTYDSAFTTANSASYSSVTANAFGFLSKVNASTAQSGCLTVGSPTTASATQLLQIDSACPGEVTSPANARFIGGVVESTSAAITGIRVTSTISGSLSSGTVSWYGDRT